MTRGTQAAALIGPSIRTSVVVGALLTAVNQWDALIASSPIPTRLIERIAANFLVPLIVALYSRWSVLRGPATTS